MAEYSLLELSSNRPVPRHRVPAVDTYMSGFRSGGAGVAFVHVLGNTGTLWSLSFNGVQAYTGP